MTWLVVGLGNPGPKYAGHRHNVGFMVVDELARRAGQTYASKFKGVFARARIEGEDLVLLKPQTFMNVSGTSVGAAASFFKIGMDRTIVIHDELDLAYGQVRLKVGGGHAGHNGLRSIFQHAGKDFVRVRCGIGRPQHGDVAHFVLSDFSADERISLSTFVDDAARAVEYTLGRGALAAMNALHPEQKAKAGARAGAKAKG